MAEIKWEYYLYVFLYEIYNVEENCILWWKRCHVAREIGMGRVWRNMIG